MFPIWDAQGRMVAFGGRAMGDAMPKYINSSETPVYSKSRHLYGLFQGLATLRKERHVVILEGYMDVVTCHQFGLDITAATLGTALTDDHVRMLRRYAEKVTLLFDPDAAGAQASLRGGELLIEDGFTVDVVTLPDGVDADEILVQSGRAALEGYLEKAVPFMDYFIAAAQKKYPGLAPENKLAIAREVLPVIHKIKDPLLQDEYLGRLANTLRVEKAILGQQMKRLKLSPEERAVSQKTASPQKPAVSSLLTIEEEMIRLALQYPSEQVEQALSKVTWLDKRCAAVWSVARTKLAAGTLQISEVLTALSEEVQEWLTPLVLQEREYAHPTAMLEELDRSVAAPKRGARVAGAQARDRFDDRGPYSSRCVKSAALQQFVETSQRFQTRVEHFEGGSTSWLNQRTLQNQKTRSKTPNTIPLKG